jgi:hypothetical protein
MTHDEDCPPSTQRSDRDLIEGRQLGQADSQVGTGDQAEHIEERLST